MNKVMILAILVAYKAFNDKSLTIVINEGEGEYVLNKAIVDSIDGDGISDIDSNLVYIRDKDKNLYCIELDDIIGIQFIDERAIVGMK